MECFGRSSLKEKSEQILCGGDYQKEEDGMDLKLCKNYERKVCF